MIGKPPVRSPALSREAIGGGAVRVGANCSIGVNAVIYEGVTIGADSLVGDFAAIREINGRRVLAADRRRGQRVLQTVCDTRPSLRRRVGVGLSAIPGTGKALAGTYFVTDKLRAAIRSSRPATG